MLFWSTDHTFTSVLFSSPSKSESCVGSWTPLRRRLRPWRLSWLPMWVCWLQKALSKQSAHLSDNPPTESFRVCVCVCWGGYKSLRHPLIPFLCVWSWCVVCLGFCLLTLLVYVCCVCMCVCMLVCTCKDSFFAFRLCWWGFNKTGACLSNSAKQRESNGDRRAQKKNREMRIRWIQTWARHAWERQIQRPPAPRPSCLCAGIQLHGQSPIVRLRLTPQTPSMPSVWSSVEATLRSGALITKLCRSENKG